MAEPVKTATPVRTLPPVTPNASANPQGPKAAPRAATASRTAPQIPARVRKSSDFSTVPFWVGLALSILWVGAVITVLSQTGSAHTFGGLPLINWAIGISAIVSPVGLIWMVTAYLQRAADVQSVAEPLRRQLLMITGESGAAEVRIRRFNHAIREQLELLKSTQQLNHADLMAIMDRVRQHKNDLEQFEQNSIYQVKEIQEVVRRSMQHIEQLLDDKFTMLRILDGKLVQSGDEIARQTDSVRDQLGSLLQEIETNTRMVGQSLERATQDGKKLTETTRAQEMSLTGAAETVSSTMNELSGKIDASIARFLERTGTAREEAERLAVAFTAQTNALDEVSRALPARVSETEIILRGATDRLYASEQAVNEQAADLGQKLAAQVDSLQQVFNRFGDRFTDIDALLQQRRNDMEGLVVRVSGATDDLAQRLETSVKNYDERTQANVKQMGAINENARRSAEEASTHMDEATARYEDSIRRLDQLAESSHVQLRAITEEISTQQMQFETLQHASQQASLEVQSRASAALQNMQQVLGRLLAVRDATQSIGESLADKLRAAADQNDFVMTRISETARMTVEALNAAATSLEAREDSIGAGAKKSEETLRAVIDQLQEQAINAEDALRSRHKEFGALMDNMKGRLEDAEQRWQAFASEAATPVKQVVEQIELSTTLGTEQLNRYGETLQMQFDRLQQVNEKTGDMSNAIQRTTAETLSTLEQIGSRFMATQAAQEETARIALDQFGKVADRLRQEVGALDEHTAAAIDSLQKTAMQVSAESRASAETITKGTLEQFDKIADRLRQEVAALDGHAAQAVTTVQKTAAEVGQESRTAQETLVRGSLEQFDKIAERMRQEAAAIDAHATQAIASVQKTATEVGQESRAAQDHIAQNILGRFDAVAERLRQEVANLDSHAAQALATVQKTASSVGEESRSAQDHIAQNVLNQFDRVTERLRQEVANIDSHAAQALASVQKTAADVNQETRTAQDEIVRMTLGKFDTITERLRQEVADIDTHAAQAVANVQKTATDVGQEARTAQDEIVRVMLGQFDTIAARLRKEVAALDDQTMLAVASLQRTAMDVGQESRTTQEKIVGDALGQFDRLTDRLHKGAEDLDTHAAQAIASVQKTATQVTDESRIAQETLARQTIEQFDKIAERVRQDAGSIDAQTAQAIAKLQKNAADVNAESRAAQEAVTRGALEQFDKIVERLKQEVGTLDAQALQAVASLQKNAAQVGTESRTAQEEITRSTMQQFDSIVERLKQEVTTLDTQSTQAVATLQKTADQVSTESRAAQAVIARNTMEQFDAIAARLREEVGALDTQATQAVASLRKSATELGDESRTGAETITRAAIEPFNAIVTQLRQEFHSIDGEAAQATTSIQTAATKVAEETKRIGQEAQSAGLSMRDAASTLQTESARIHAELQKQAGDVRDTLAETEQCLATMGDSLQSRAETARTALDRLTTHYQETTRAATDEFESRSAKLEQTASAATAKVEALNTSIAQQLSTIDHGSAQLEAQASQLSSVSQKTLQQLSMLNEKFGVTQEATSRGVQQTVAQLEEANNAFLRQNNSLNDSAQSAVAMVQKVGAALGEQTGRMLDTTQQIEQGLRSLNATTMAFADQSAQVRTSMEQHNQRLVGGMNDAVAQLDASAAKIQQTTAQANTSVDAIAARFGEMTQNATAQLGQSSDALTGIARKAETTLDSLGANVTQQVASLNILNDQLTEQYGTLSTANENHKKQLTELFEKLNTAHGQASTVAEQTITRLTDSVQQIQRQITLLGDQSQAALNNARTVGTGFADQASLLIQHAQQAEQQARTVLSVTASLQDQARQLREAMHGESERTGEILGSILSKLGSGTTGLRELNATAESTLSNLQHGLSGQADTLNASMQQITDRQRNLTTALDAQRDVLNGLISRLTMAQDETAAAAERNVARLSESASTITRQMETLESQATNTLANVRAAGASFADEAGALNMQAQQTEQQTRGMLAVAAGLQDQARQVREGMQTESTRVIEQLNTVLTQLNTTSDHLKQQSSGIVHSMDQSVLQFTTLAKTTDETLRQQASNLATVAIEAETRVLGVGEKMGEQFKHVSTAADHAEEQAKRLAEAAGYATARLTTMQSTLADTDRDARTLLDQANARVSEVKAILQQELDQVARISQLAVEQVAAAGRDLQSQSDALRTNLAASESALTQAATLVREESAHVPAVLDRSTQQIELVGRAFKEKTGAIDETMVRTADRFISVTGAARDTMMDEMRNLSEVSATADQILRQFNETLSAQLDAIRKGHGELSDEQAAMVAKANETMSQLAAASERMGTLHANAFQMTEKLAREFGSIETKASATAQRMLQAGEGLGKQVEQLSQASERAENQMMGASQNFREQLERIRTGVQMQIDDINRGLMQITAQLERTGTSLRSATTSTIADVEKITSRFDQTSKETAHQLMDRTARMRVATEEVAKLLNGFGDQMDVLLDRMATSGDGIKKYESDLIGQLQTALTHLGSITQRLESSRVLTADVSDEAVSRLNEVAEAVERHVRGIKEDSHAVIGVMQDVGQACLEKAGNANRSVAETQVQVAAMAKTIEDMQQRTDRTRVALKLQGEDLINTLSQIMGQINAGGDSMTDLVSQVVQQQQIGGQA